MKRESLEFRALPILLAICLAVAMLLSSCSSTKTASVCSAYDVHWDKHTYTTR